MSTTDRDLIAAADAHYADDRAPCAGCHLESTDLDAEDLCPGCRPAVECMECGAVGCADPHDVEHATWLDARRALYLDALDAESDPEGLNYAAGIRS